MARKTMRRYLSICLAVVMLLTTLLPVGAYAVDDSVMDDTAVNYVEPARGDSTDEQVGQDEQGSEPEAGGEVSEAPAVKDYATFLSSLKVLEGYARDYAAVNAGENANALIVNYIRTCVERYTSCTWEMVCGK